jgi:hypothetical protein
MECSKAPQRHEMPAHYFDKYFPSSIVRNVCGDLKMENIILSSSCQATPLCTHITSFDICLSDKHLQTKAQNPIPSFQLVVMLSILTS